MLLHASYNVFVQSVFDPLTIDTGNTEFLVGEFGIGTALGSALIGYVFWRRRNELPDRSKPADPETDWTSIRQPDFAQSNAGADVVMRQ
jgi:hypothetical protein